MVGKTSSLLLDSRPLIDCRTSRRHCLKEEEFLRAPRSYEQPERLQDAARLIPGEGASYLKGLALRAAKYTPWLKWEAKTPLRAPRVLYMETYKIY